MLDLLLSLMCPIFFTSLFNVGLIIKMEHLV